MCVSNFIGVYFVWGTLSFGGFFRGYNLRYFPILSLLGFWLLCCFLLSCIVLNSIHFSSISFSFIQILLYSHSLQMAKEHINLFSQSSEFILVNVLFVSLLILPYLFTLDTILSFNSLIVFLKFFWNMYGSCFEVYLIQHPGCLGISFYWLSFYLLTVTLSCCFSF